MQLFQAINVVLLLSSMASSFEVTVLRVMQEKAAEVYHQKEELPADIAFLIDAIVREQDDVNKEQDNLLAKKAASCYVRHLDDDLIRDLFILSSVRYMNQEDFYDKKEKALSPMVCYYLKEALGEENANDILLKENRRSQLGNSKKHMQWLLMPETKTANAKKKRNRKTRRQDGKPRTVTDLITFRL